MLHSDKLTKYTGTFNPSLKEAISQISEYFGLSTPEIFKYKDFSIVIKASYDVSLPRLGAVGGLDIRHLEPVLIELWIDEYPHIAPRILSDRLDFPRTKLSHLYLTGKDSPATLCLVRESPNQWFADRKLVDLLEVGNQWFYKAGAGLLNEDGGEFDPTRLEELVFGHHIYKYEMPYSIITNNERFVADYPMAVCIAGQYSEKIKTVDYKSVSPVQMIQLPNLVAEFKKLYADNQLSGKDAPIFSIVLWHPENLIEDEYVTSLPANYGELKQFFAERQIQLKPILMALESLGIFLKGGIPVIYGMKRPKKMIGYAGEYEFFNFVITDVINGITRIKDASKVFFQQHLQPFSPMLASEISGQNRTLKTLYVGAGSLGSKIILHDARSGNLQIGVVDHDKYLLHNQVRHVLFKDKVGLNKADAIIEKIKEFYDLDNTSQLVSYPRNVIFLSANDFQGYELIVDTSANLQVRNYLAKKTLPMDSRYVRTEIVDEGTLGLLYAEGNQRNPRMDDLNYLVSFLATQDLRLSEWRKADVKRETVNLNLGLGCSSSTSVLADDSLDFHASLASKILAEYRPTVLTHGLINISKLDNSGNSLQIENKKISVKPFEILECQNGSGWEIRCYSGITEKLLNQCDEKSPNETGGVLIGVANYKLKTIHIFDIINEPIDSTSSPIRFTRGINGLPETIDDVKLKSGNILGYVGEWHSHPMNLTTLSPTDLATVEQLKLMNGRVPIPTLAIIVTPKKVIPFVFE